MTADQIIEQGYVELNGNRYDQSIIDKVYRILKEEYPKQYSIVKKGDRIEIRKRSKWSHAKYGDIYDKLIKEGEAIVNNYVNIRQAIYVWAHKEGYKIKTSTDCENGKMIVRATQ